MNTWQVVWREGIAPVLSVPGLRALQDAQAVDDPRLLQTARTVPPPLEALRDWPVSAACALSTCGCLGEGLPDVGAVKKYFARVVYEAGCRLGDLEAVRHFLNFWDEMPRKQARRELLAEVNRTLAERTGQTQAA